MEVFNDTAMECHLPYGITHVLPATRHKWTHPALTPAMQAGTRFTYPGGMEGWKVWVDLVDLIAPRPGVEPATFRSRVRRSTTAPPRQVGYMANRWYRIDRLFVSRIYVHNHAGERKATPICYKVLIMGIVFAKNVEVKIKTLKMWRPWQNGKKHCSLNVEWTMLTFIR